MRDPIVKIAVADINLSDIRTHAMDRDDPEILQYFKKTAADLKAIAPKAKDFLYFTCVMMHAAEAALLDDGGQIKKGADGKEVKASWNKLSNGSWVWESSDPNVMPYKNSNCLVPGTSILMSDGGVKPIEDIKVGDEVITHKGRVKKVKHIFKHFNNSYIFDIKSKYNQLLSVTSEHPLFTIKNNKKKLSNLIKNNPEISWNKAQDVSIGDYLASFNTFDIPNVESDLTPDQCRLLGYFAAEGSFSKKYGKRQSAVLTFGIHEQNITDHVQEIVSREFPECSVKINKNEVRNVINVSISGHNISDWFYYHVGEYSHDKKLSNDLVFSSAENKRQFLLGWMEGDGCLTTGNKLVGISTSENMSWQIWSMLKSLGYSVGMRKKEQGKRKINNKYEEYNCRPQYRIEVYGANAHKLCQDDSVKYSLQKTSHKNVNNSYGNYDLHYVSYINVRPYQGYVYNFEVEDDHSYVANGVIVHNSDIFPEEELKKAYKKWVGKPLCLDHQSQSVDMIRGVIIDTVYDEKKKRVIALCALDKANYPELAKKVASGVAASVSMGTAVGKAICTEKGCHRVARTESEFCEHMRAKSCYGEINVDLSPIELSIVVNGADPKAKIRRVIAAADKIAGYVDKQKLDEAGITVDEAKTLRDNLDREIQNLQAEAGDNIPLPNEGSDIEPPYGQGGRASKDIEHPTDDIAPRGNVPQAATTARYASEVVEVLEKLREKVGQLDNFINKMASVKEGSKQINEDTVMANKKEAYFQGGGGVNEPTPHQVKYPKEDSDSIRENDDKQMNGQSPFPDVGPVDGMHPGYESFGESEVERKKRLQRLAAEQQQRQLRREAAMEKAKDLIKQRREAYFQGGGDVNEPTPHKPKYPKEDSDSIRDKEDKQMVGAPPFPGVGKIDGLYGDDEKVKKMHLRADVKLNASFVKAANPDGSDNLSDSCWNVFAKDAAGNKRLVLSATVAELAGKDRVSTLYTGIATPEYGRKIIQTIREAGLEAAHGIFKGANDPTDPTLKDFEVVLPGGQTRMLTSEEWEEFANTGALSSGLTVRRKSWAPGVLKGAQAQPPAPAVPGGQPGAAPDAAAPAPVPAGPTAAPGAEMDEDPEYAGETGSAVDKLEDSVRELGNLVAEMEKGLEGLKEEQGELGADAPEVAGVPAGAVTTAAVRLQLNKALIKGFKQAIAEAEDVKEELELVKHVVATGADRGNEGLVKELYADAQSDVKKAKANISTMLESFVSYANGNEIMEKVADGEITPPPSLPTPSQQVVNPRDTKGQPMADDYGMAGDSLYDLLKGDDDPEELDETEEEEIEQEETESEEEESDEEDEDESYALELDMATNKMTGDPGDWKEVLASMSRQERDALRVKLAQKGLTFSDMLQKAHPQGGTTTDLDVKPQDKGDHVEDLKEAHDVHMDVATSAPRNVRMAAEKIQRLVTAGEIDPGKDFPALIAEGLDPQAVAYWKNMWGGTDPEAGKFVGDLVKDYHNKKAAEEKQSVQVKVARAYELAYAMAERGLISRDPRSLRQQVDRVMGYPDDAFNDFAKQIGKLPVKQASISDVASVNGSYNEDRVVTSNGAIVPPSRDEGTNTLVDLFDQAFSGRRY